MLVLALTTRLRTVILNHFNLDLGRLVAALCLASTELLDLLVSLIVFENVISHILFGPLRLVLWVGHSLLRLFEQRPGAWIALESEG